MPFYIPSSSSRSFIVNRCLVRENIMSWWEFAIFQRHLTVWSSIASRSLIVLPNLLLQGDLGTVLLSPAKSLEVVWKPQQTLTVNPYRPNGSPTWVSWASAPTMLSRWWTKVDSTTPRPWLTLGTLFRWVSHCHLKYLAWSTEKDLITVTRHTPSSQASPTANYCHPEKGE